jgi:hypothetical protein
MLQFLHAGAQRYQAIGQLPILIFAMPGALLQGPHEYMRAPQRKQTEPSRAEHQPAKDTETNH